MKERKLTKALVAKIADSVIEAMQNKLEAQLKPIRAELSPLLYATLLAKHNLSLDEVMAVPPTWLPSVGVIRIGGCAGQPKSGYIGIPLHTEWAWPIPAFVPHRYDIEIEMIASPDRKDVAAIIVQHDDIRIQSYRLRDWQHIAKVQNIVAAFRTVEGLISQLPEMAAHVPELDTVQGVATSKAIVAVDQVRKDLML